MEPGELEVLGRGVDQGVERHESDDFALLDVDAFFRRERPDRFERLDERRLVIINHVHGHLYEPAIREFESFRPYGRHPPSLSRMDFAIRFAVPTSVVRRFTFQAIRTGRAPTMHAPAVGWSLRGPKSGLRSGFVAISTFRPSYSPRRTSGRARRSGRVAAASYR